MSTRTEMAVEYGLMLLLLGAVNTNEADTVICNWDEEALSLVRDWLPADIRGCCDWSHHRQLFLLALDLPNRIMAPEYYRTDVEALRARCAVKARSWSTTKLEAELAILTAKLEAIDMTAYRQRKAEEVLARTEARLVMEDESTNPIPQFSVAASYLLNKELTRTPLEVFCQKEHTKPLAEKLAVYTSEDGQWKLVEVVDVTKEGREYGRYQMVVPFRHGSWDYYQWGFAPWWNGYSRAGAIAECMA